jgi:hypothetical protein
MTIEPAGYVIFDNEAIHGAGKTADEAWDDFERAMKAAGTSLVDEAPDEDMPGNWTKRSNFSIRSASENLLWKVRYQGGDIAWAVCNGIACTMQEYDGQQS